MRLFAWQYFYCLTLVFLCGYANAGALVKRASGDSSGSSSSGSGSGSDDQSALMGYITSLENMLGRLPVVGSRINGLIDWLVKFVSLFESGTNGALGRLLGGALPCTVSLDGTVCTGLAATGGFGDLLMDVINDVPGLVLPGFLKSLIGLGIQALIDPTMDVLFGGVAVDS